MVQVRNWVLFSNNFTRQNPNVSIAAVLANVINDFVGSIDSILLMSQRTAVIKQTAANNFLALVLGKEMSLQSVAKNE